MARTPTTTEYTTEEASPSVEAAPEASAPGGTEEPAVVLPEPDVHHEISAGFGGAFVMRDGVRVRDTSVPQTDYPMPGC